MQPPAIGLLLPGRIFPTLLAATDLTTSPGAISWQIGMGILSNTNMSLWKQFTVPSPIAECLKYTQGAFVIILEVLGVSHRDEYNFRQQGPARP